MPAVFANRLRRGDLSDDREYTEPGMGYPGSLRIDAPCPGSVYSQSSNCTPRRNRFTKPAGIAAKWIRSRRTPAENVKNPVFSGLSEFRGSADNDATNILAIRGVDRAMHGLAISALTLGGLQHQHQIGRTEEASLVALLSRQDSRTRSQGESCPHPRARGTPRSRRARRRRDLPAP